MKKKPSRKLADEVADESRSTQITVAADMVFSLSKNLSGVSDTGPPLPFLAGLIWHLLLSRRS